MKETVKNRLAILKRAASSRTNPISIDVLASAIRDPSPRVRSEAIQIISERKIEVALPIVDKLLSDKSESVRIDAIACLGLFQQRSKDSGKKIQRLLRDRSFLVRIEALESLAILRYQGALPLIVTLLNDKNPLVRAYAARAIAALGGVSYVERLQDILRLEKHESARAGFLEAMLLLGKKEVFGSFLELLHSRDYRVRCAVANALEEIPLDRAQTEFAVRALSEARQHALVLADKSSVSRVLRLLRKTA
jgi:HEAT repeat protein